MNPENLIGWSVNWAWGLPLIVFTVMLHAYSLGLLNADVTARLNKRGRLGRPLSAPGFLIGGTALSLTVLHGAEGIRAAAYRLLGASMDCKSAMLYSALSQCPTLTSLTRVSPGTVNHSGSPDCRHRRCWSCASRHRHLQR
jgi:hypothetical protein